MPKNVNYITLINFLEACVTKAGDSVDLMHAKKFSIRFLIW